VDENDPDGLKVDQESDKEYDRNEAKKTRGLNIIDQYDLEG
jgi:hypothetical protein